MYNLTKINDKIYIESYKGNEEKIIIPKEINGEPIYGIASFSFMDFEAKEIIISENIKDIQENAFIGCENLETVYLENIPCKYTNLDECFQKDIENILFLNCNEKNFTLYVTAKYMIMRYIDIFKNPNTKYKEEYPGIYLEKLPDEVEEIYIPDTYNGKDVYLVLKDLHYNDLIKIRFPAHTSWTAAEFPNLIEINISPKANISYIPDAFKLRKLIFYKNTKKIYTENIFYRDIKDIPIEDDNELTYFPVKKFSDSEWFEKIPEENNGEKVYKGILMKYSRKKLIMNFYEYEIPKNVKFIANEVFSGENDLENIHLNNTERIGESSFAFTEKLKDIIFPKKVKFIGKNAFSDYKFAMSEFNEYKKCTFEGDKNLINIEEDAF